MGHESIVYGYINAICSIPPRNEELYHQNQKVIQELPDQDDYPWITKWMFSTIPIDTQHIYRNQIIHFGASYKEVEDEWDIWLSKFENILKKLYWISAIVHLETETVGKSCL